MLLQVTTGLVADSTIDDLPVVWGGSPGAEGLSFVLCSGRPGGSQDVGWAGLLSGGSGESTLLSSILLAGTIRFLAAVGLRPCFFAVCSQPLGL